MKNVSSTIYFKKSSTDFMGGYLRGGGGRGEFVGINDLRGRIEKCGQQMPND